MSIVIVGAHGYIGSKLLKRLSRTEEECFGLVRSNKNSDEYFIFRLLENEIETKIWTGNIEKLSEGLRQINAKQIINLAAELTKECSIESIRKLCRDNIEFNSILAFSAVEAKIKHFVYSSTYSTSIDGLTYSPQTFYAASKKASEDNLIFFAQSNNLKVTILQFYDVYGPHQPHKRIVNTMLEALVDNKKLHISSGEQEINLIHIEDLISAMELIMAEDFPHSKNNFEYFTIAGNEVVRIRDLPLIISKALGINWEEKQIIHDLPSRKNEIWKFRPMHKRLPNWEPHITMEIGIRSLMWDKP